MSDGFPPDLAIPVAPPEVEKYDKKEEAKVTPKSLKATLAKRLLLAPEVVNKIRAGMLNAARSIHQKQAGRRF